MCIFKIYFRRLHTMAVKDVEMFVLEKRKNEALKKEWDKATKKEDKLREDKKEAFFNKKLHPIIKKYGFDFSFDDFCEYKKNSAKPQSGDEELSDDELFNVAGGGYKGTAWQGDEIVRAWDNSKKNTTKLLYKLSSRSRLSTI